MKANELRIGNLVNIGYDCNVVRIDEFGATLNTCNGVKDLLYFHQTDIRPIPLTEEWLVRAGFTESNPKDYFYIYNPEHDVEVYILSENGKFYLAYYGEIRVEPISAEINHVHQLQNLYHALTGEELTIKPTEG